MIFEERYEKNKYFIDLFEDNIFYNKNSDFYKQYYHQSIPLLCISGHSQLEIRLDFFELYIHFFCQKYYIKNYTINNYLSVDVNNNVNLYNKNLEYLPFQFGKVKNFFFL